MSDSGVGQLKPPRDPEQQWSSWAPLVRVLSEQKMSGKRVLFIANPGNPGDALIASATWQLFDRLQLSVRPSRARDIRRGDVVLYGGGGNLIPLYRDVRLALELAIEREVGRFVLLPHTVRGHEDLLVKLDQRFWLFCRDRVSLAHVSRHTGGAHVGLCPDMALGLNVPQLMERAASLRVVLGARAAVLRRGRWRRYAGWLAATEAFRPAATGQLEVMRSDVEAAAGPGAKSGDLSGLYDSALRSRSECDALTARFLGVIGRASAVRTDRLHVAIGAQLLGKPVTLMDNSYGKNHAVASAFRELMPLVTLAATPSRHVRASGSAAAGAPGSVSGGS